MQNEAPPVISTLTRTGSDANNTGTLVCKSETNPHRPVLTASYKSSYRECAGIPLFPCCPRFIVPAHSRYKPKGHIGTNIGHEEQSAARQ
jgi:hypothetical protein